MDKQEFLKQLRDRLLGLPQDELEERLGFYEEMIDDRMEEGVSEEEAVAAVGTVDEIFAQIVEEVPLSKLVKETIRPKRRMKAWETVLLILGSPLWLALLIALAAIVFSLYVSLWAVVVSLWAAVVSFGATALGSVLGGVGFVCGGFVLQGLALLGAAFLLAGVSVFGFYGCKSATKGAALLTQKILFGIKRLFIGKEEA